MYKPLIAGFLWLMLTAAFTATTAWSADPDAALKLARDTSEQMLAALKKNRTELEKNPNKIYDLVHKIALPHFDFRLISQWILGKYWRSASAEQRERFTEEFRTLLVHTYAKALLEYIDAEIEFLPVNAASDNDVTIRSQINPGGGPAIPINYNMHYKKGAWKVYDVSVDGISLVTNYRGSIGSQIKKEGLDAVIAKISERNQSSR